MKSWSAKVAHPSGLRFHSRKSATAVDPLDDPGVATLSGPGIEQRIEKFAIFENVVLESSLKTEPGFFQHSCRTRIAREYLRRNSTELPIGEAEISDRGHHFGHDAASPK